MITAIRRHLHGAAYKISIWIIILILGVGFMPSLLRHSTTGGQWALRVNEQEVGYKEYAYEVAEQRDRIAGFRAQYGQYADMLLESMGMSVDPKTLAFDVLVKEELTTQVADLLNMHLHPDYIADKLNDPSFLYQELASYVPLYSMSQTGGIDQKILYAHLQRKGITIDDFERKAERVLARNLVADLVQAASYVPSFELEQQYRANKLGKKFSILTFSRDDFIKQEKQKEVSDKELKDFFDRENAQYKRYWVPEKRSGEVWKVSPESYGITITDDQIKEYYEKNKSANKYVKDPAQVQVRTILFKVDDVSKKEEMRVKAHNTRSELLQNPARFAEVARDVSDDEETKKNGGLVPFFAKNEKERIFERTAFLLKEKDAVSEMIETSEGFQLLQLVEKKPRVIKSLDEVKTDIKKELMLKEFKTAFARDAKKALEQGDKSVRNFVESKKATKSSLADTEQDSSKAVQALFKLKQNDASYYLDSDTGIVVELVDIKKRYLPSFEEIKDTVMQDLYAHKAVRSLQQDLEKARQQSGIKSFDQLKDEFHASLQTTDLIKPDDEKQLEKLNKKGIPTDILLQLEKENSVLTQETDQGGVLIRLDEMEAFDPEGFAAQQAEIKDTLEKERTRLLIEGFVASLYRNATIETNESVFATQA